MSLVMSFSHVRQALLCPLLEAGLFQSPCFELIILTTRKQTYLDLYKQTDESRSTPEKTLLVCIPCYHTQPLLPSLQLVQVAHKAV